MSCLYRCSPGMPHRGVLNEVYVNKCLLFFFFFLVKITWNTANIPKRTKTIVKLVNHTRIRKSGVTNLQNVGCILKQGSELSVRTTRKANTTTKRYLSFVCLCLDIVILTGAPVVLGIYKKRIPTHRKQTSWLFSNAIEELNLRQQSYEKILASGQSGTWTRKHWIPSPPP